MCIQELERRYTCANDSSHESCPHETSQVQLPKDIDKDNQPQQQSGNSTDLNHNDNPHHIMGIISIYHDSSDDDDDDEDDTWMSVDSVDNNEVEDEKIINESMNNINIINTVIDEEKKDDNFEQQMEGIYTQDNQDMINEEKEKKREQEIKDEQMYKTILPQRDDHVLCNFAITCMYMGGYTTEYSAVNHGKEEGGRKGRSQGQNDKVFETGVQQPPHVPSYWRDDHFKALRSLQMVVDLQIQPQPPSCF